MKYTKTNSEIIFHNKSANELNDKIKLQKIMDRPLAPLNTKRQINEEFVTKSSDTYNRLFGTEVEKYSLNRAAFLREKDLRGKTNNIVSGIVNHVELKANAVNLH